MGSIFSLRIVSGWKTEEDEAPRPISLNLISLYRCLKAVIHRITPRKTAGPFLPLQNPTPKPSDHPPLKQSLLIYNSDAESECPNIHVFSDHCLEENQEYSSQTKNTIPSFDSHPIDSYSTSSVTGTDSAVFTQENAPRKNISYAEHEEMGTGDQVCEESSDQCLEQNQEYYRKVKDIIDSVTTSIPNFNYRAFEYYTPSSSTYTDSSAIIQENAPQKNFESPGICISTEKKIQESSQEKKRKMKKVIESTAVVEKATWIKHYSSSHRILLVGEGDFSFSYSLAAAFGCASKMVATSLDSKEFLKKNYAKAPRNIRELKKRGCIVMHGIDATTIATQQLLKHKTFDRIIYNFPFAGFFEGRDSSLRRHRRLVSLFLKNAKEMIDESGEIHISHKTNGYHSEWNLVSIASSHGLRLIDEVEFDLSDYPGYNTKRGFGGDENFNCYPSNTFKFGLKLVGRGYACKCGSKCGVQGHNKKTCTSNISPPNPIINEEIVASQEEPISPLTPELECQRPQKLPVRRKTSSQKDAHGCSKAAPTGRIKNKLMGSDEVHVQPVEQTVAASLLSTYQQFQECQNLAQMNINAHARSKY